MKKILFSLLILLSLNGYAQSYDVNEFKIPLKVILPENLDILNSRELSGINTRITTLVTQTGLSGGAYAYTNFVIFPKILINSMDMVETGMTNIYKTSIDISLFVKDVENDIIFGTTTITINGNGLSRDLAIANAIQSFPKHDDKIDLFFKSSKSKIIDYYNAKCSTILEKADGLASQQRYEEAIGLVYSIPEEIACFSTGLKKVSTYYKAYQNRVCNSKIQAAKVKAASRDFVGALDILTDLDPLTTCRAESEKIIAKCFSNLTAEDVRNYKTLLLFYQNENELEKRRIKAARDISVAYYRSQPSTIIYNSRYEYNRLILF